jgi:hypothetical protein
MYVDARQFQAALDQVDREMVQTGAVSDQAARAQPPRCLLATSRPNCRAERRAAEERRRRRPDLWDLRREFEGSDRGPPP